ncbi:hypothetical protein CBR_g23310 [Chara braunii]|uniref:Pentacotripeptide-repeat region of PRORP domain-containing protein n=1 Tax=Chara braunii TaxID=69332 RepID=A0A388L3U3_CHABU|nr:hypothetical protein CBR_g23310 [Chara braunii]|eukprot:GBG76979.1 hypothetical protein CBR_g23310 [Chara braunii]
MFCPNCSPALHTSNGVVDKAFSRSGIFGDRLRIGASETLVSDGPVLRLSARPVYGAASRSSRRMDCVGKKMLVAMAGGYNTTGAFPEGVQESSRGRHVPTLRSKGTAPVGATLKVSEPVHSSNDRQGDDPSLPQLKPAKSQDMPGKRRRKKRLSDYGLMNRIEVNDEDRVGRVVWKLLVKMQNAKSKEELEECLEDHCGNDRAKKEDVLRACRELRNSYDWQRVAQTFYWMLRYPVFKPDVDTFNLLMDVCCKLNKYGEAEAVFRSMDEVMCMPNVTTYNVMMNVYRKSGETKKAELLFTRLKAAGYRPGLVTYNTIIDMFGKAGLVSKAEEVFEEMIERRCFPVERTYISLINMYGRAQMADKAEKMFREMKGALRTADLRAYTALISAFGRNGLIEKAEAAYDEMTRDGVNLTPDVYCLNALMDAYCKGGRPAAAEGVFTEMQARGLQPDEATYNILIDAYGRQGLCEDAEAVLEKMVAEGLRPGLTSYTVLLTGLAKAGRIDDTERIFKELQRHGLQPDTYLYNSLLTAYGTSQQYDKMLSLEARMRAEIGSGQPHVRLDVSTYNTLIHVNCELGLTERAEELFAEVSDVGLTPDSTTWTALIGGYAKKKLLRKCLQLFKKMVAAGCTPDRATSRVLLSACRSPEQVEEVTKQFATASSVLQSE